MRTYLFLATAVLAACGDNGSQIDAPINSDAPLAIDGATVDAPVVVIDAPDPRGPATFTLSGGANAVRWDDATSTLYLTDNNANALLRFTDAGGIQTVGTFPAASAGISLGDVVKRSGDGTILTASFGFGTQGTLFAMAPDNTSSALTGMVANRRRIGLSQDSNGVLYEAYFVGGGGGMPTGGIATVTIAGGVATEVEVLGTGLKKVVGLVATPTALFVTDQTDSELHRITVPGFVDSVIATPPSADLLTMMPNGDLLTGGNGVHRITQAGVVTTPFTGFEQVRGLAYDPTLRRLFIIEHSATVGTPDKLHVRPLDN